MKNIESFMKLILPESVWRWDHFTDKYDNCPLGDGQWLMIKDKLIYTAQEFVKEVFSYEKIILTSPEKHKIKTEEEIKTTGELEKDNEHCQYTFKIAFGEFLYYFQVKNIPVSSNTEQVESFFTAVLNYLSSAYFSLESNLSQHQQGYLLASNDLMRIADSFVLNFHKTVMIEYLYNVFNFEKQMHGNNAWIIHDKNKYNLELLEKIYELANELSSRKIENKEIYTGFIFHGSEDELERNSVKRVKLKEAIDFGSFSQIKSLIQATNGKNIFFNVINSKITHIFLTRKEVLEISMEPTGNGKNFQEKPLIVSIQGSGKVLFIQGDTDKNKTIFQIVNNNPVIKDLNFIENYLNNLLSKEIGGNINPHFFAKWLLSIPVQKKGTTVVIGDFNKEILRKKLVQYTEISIYGTTLFQNEKSHRILLDHITNPDGAIIFDKTGNILFISAILPFSQGEKVTGGGARHQSAINFTKEYNCIAIAVSEDGNITIFNRGVSEIKF